MPKASAARQGPGHLQLQKTPWKSSRWPTLYKINHNGIVLRDMPPRTQKGIHADLGSEDRAVCVATKFFQSPGFNRVGDGNALELQTTPELILNSLMLTPFSGLTSSP